MVQSINNPKKIKPILGLKSLEKANTVMIQSTGGSQKQDKLFSANQRSDNPGPTQYSANQFLSPQGHLQLHGSKPHQQQTQTGFLPNNQYLIAKKRQEAIDKSAKIKQEDAKDLFISGNTGTGRSQGMQDMQNQYRRASAGMDQQMVGTPLLPPTSKKNLNPDFSENKNTLQSSELNYR